MDDVTKQALMSALRSLLIALGSVLVARGFLNDTTWNQIVGALMTIIPVVWGIWDKYWTESKTRVREVAAADAAIASLGADATPSPTAQGAKP